MWFIHVVIQYYYPNFFSCFSDCINNPAAFFCINEISEFIVQNAHEIQHANHIDSPGY